MAQSPCRRSRGQDGLSPNRAAMHDLLPTLQRGIHGTSGSGGIVSSERGGRLGEGRRRGEKGRVLVADSVIQHQAVTRALVWSITWLRSFLSLGSHAASQLASHVAQASSRLNGLWGMSGSSGRV